MRTVIITQGLPASGKSTWAREQLKREPGRWKRLNRDDLRAMIDGSVYSKDNEKFITSVQRDLLRKALVGGSDVILDNTHLVKRTIKTLHTVCESVGDVKVIHKAFNVPVDECIKRNENRDPNVPENVIVRMAKAAGISKGRKLRDSETYYPPHTVCQKVEQDPTKTWAIVCDLDGTLADISWRNPYDASRCDEDIPNEPVINLVKAMHAAGRKICFVSGRMDKYKPQTIKFIEKHVRVNGEPIPYELHMRQSGDMRKDTVIKKEIYHNHIEPTMYVEFVVDDRPSVVRMWRYDMGFMVMQVNDKEF
jgi:predicted kinase